jgi:hypothetical protein
VRLLGWSRGRRTIASIVALAVVAGVPVTFAVLHNGFPVSDVKLNVKDVWVTNDKQSLAGRLNRQIDELTAGAQTPSSSFDVVQDGSEVFLHDEQLNTLQRIERSRVTLVQKTSVPADAEIALGKTTLTIVDPSNGKLWVVNVANGLTFDSKSTKPDVVLGAGGHATVGHDGVVYATSPKTSKLYEIAGAGSVPTVRSLSIPAKNQLSVVGDTPVILDTSSDVLITGDGKRIELHAKAMQLQQPSAADSTALVATADGLLRVPLSGGTPQAIAANIPAQGAQSDVSAPVSLDGCDYGAWAGAQRYVQQCDGGPVQRATIEQATQGADLEFRVNHDVIALNNLQNGNTWILSSKLKLVDNWAEITPPQESQTETGKQKSSQDSFEDTLAHRTAQNHPPVARDDQFGVRPGRTTILPVLDNDTDQDGDVLELTDTTAIPKEYGRIDEIDGGRALQFTPSATATGGQSFRYTVGDGRGGVADANVDLNVIPTTENHAPKSLRDASVSVEAGQSITYDVLTDWIDPDGDELSLSAASPTSSDGVEFTPDGFITFQHKSGQLGKTTVAYTVSDGTATSAGKLTVDVKAAGSLTPVGTPDFAQVFSGQATVIQPLQNDLSPSGQPLSLVSVTGGPSTATVTPNIDKGTVSVSSATPGTIYLTYKVAAASEEGEGIIRVDVLPNPDKPIPPIAVKDIAYLRAGQPTSVDVLDNDVSPAGKVLAVQSVDTTNTDPAVKVELLNNTIVRVSAPNGLTKQTQFNYTISDGQQTSVAGVTVVPVAPIVNRQPPVAVDDKQTVRAGDIASVDVLANDYSPDQEQIFVEPDLADVSDAGGGLAFVNGDTVRYEAPETAGQYSVVYRIDDQYGESATARVTFTVTAPEKGDDAPPAPVKQTARAFAGEKIRINVPLDGIDPDGDSVVLDGISAAPTMGRITDQGPTWFDYEAFTSSAGTDEFSYKVQDAYGATGTGVIDVGVIPRSDLHSQPNAVNDNVEVKPGKTISAQVLLNDSDPNGYALTLSKKLLDVSPVLDAHVSGAKVIIGAPVKEGTYSLRYQMTNGHGGTANAFVIVKVTKDAKPMYPTATDDYLLDSQVHGDSPIKVNVESLIDNPNGDDSDLVISAEGPNASKASVDQSDGVIRVTPGGKRYAVAYRVTDPTDKTLTATAFIVVPPAVSKANQTVRLRSPLPQQVVPMNGTRTWKLSDIVVAPSGKSVYITSAGTVKASNGDGTSSYVDKNTLTFTPAKDYRGSAAIVFEATDGSSTPQLLTLPITVGDPNFTDVPPTFTLLTVPIEAGESPQSPDLRDSTSDQNPSLISQMTYSNLKGATSDIAAHLDGSKLVVSSPLGVQPGTTATLTFDIHYKSFTVPGKAVITVVKSTRPLAQAVTDTAKGQRGKTTSVNVLSNDFNPYADQNKPLKLTDAHVENSADTSATVSFTADGNVTVHPDASFIGVVSVVYTERDASLDPSRDQQGRLLLTVRDVPSQPSPPQIVSQQDGSVTVSWQAPATNGEPILDYTITTSNGAQKTVDASVAQTTISGLSNGSSYTFQISARNALGDSTISSKSDSAIPYTVPGAPASASITAATTGTGVLTMSWGASADNGGRSVSGYTWKLSDGQTGTTSALSATATGTVGTSYTFTVVANNPAGSSTVRTSGAATPLPGKPTVSLSAPGGAGNYALNASYGGVVAHGFTDSQISYSWALTGFGSGSSSGGSSFSKTGSASTGYTLTVTATVNGVSSSASASATTPGAPVTTDVHICRTPKDGTWYAGFQWSGLSGGAHTMSLGGNPDWTTQSHSLSGSSGTYITQSWRAIGAGSDNTGVSVYVNYDGTSSPPVQWGNTPVC